MKRLLSALLIATGRDAWRLFLRNRTRRRRGSCAAHDPLTRPAALSRARTLPRELWRSDRRFGPVPCPPRGHRALCPAARRAAQVVVPHQTLSDPITVKIYSVGDYFGEQVCAPSVATRRALHYGGPAPGFSPPSLSALAAHCTALLSLCAPAGDPQGRDAHGRHRRGVGARFGTLRPTSAPGPGSPRPHLRRDRAHPAHICAETRATNSRARLPSADGCCAAARRYECWRVLRRTLSTQVLTIAKEDFLWLLEGTAVRDRLMRLAEVRAERPLRAVEYPRCPLRLPCGTRSLPCTHTHARCAGPVVRLAQRADGELAPAAAL